MTINEQTAAAQRKAGRPKGTERGSCRHMTEEELARFMKVVRVARPEDRLLMALVYTFALRVTEAVTLRWEDIDVRLRRITVRALKAGAVQPYTISPDLWRLVAKHLKLREVGEDWLFPARQRHCVGRHITAQSAKNIFKRIAGKAGITGQSIHSLRCNQAMTMAGDGDGQALIAGWLRHTSVKSALAYTVPVINAELEAKQARRMRKYL